MSSFRGRRLELARRRASGASMGRPSRKSRVHVIQPQTLILLTGKGILVLPKVDLGSYQKSCRVEQSGSVLPLIYMLLFR